MSRSFSLVRYTLFPEILPRLRDLVTSGFGVTAYMIAILFRTAGLLPIGHAYFQPENIGRYGLRHVLAAGANHLVFRRENIDQILLYSGVMTGLVLIAMQVVLFIIAAIAAEPALAQIVPPGEIVSANNDTSNDIVFMMLDRVFGTQGIFDSCISQVGTACNDIRGNSMPGTDGAYPYPFHIALHKALQFYSSVMFILGFIMLGYYVVAIVSETAVYGTPFGKRMNKVWFPVRMILFFALLTPLNIGGANAGLNLAQIITLRAAKIGSNVATNGWNRFIGVLADPEGRTDEFIDPVNPSLINRNPALNDKFIANPGTPDLGALIRFMMLARTCKAAEEAAFKKDKPELHDIEPYLVRSPQALPMIENNQNVVSLVDTEFDEARRFVKYSNIIIRFGIKSEEGDANYESFKDFKGKVSPTCGDIVLPIKSTDQTDQVVVNSAVTGASKMQEFYYNLIRDDLWDDPTLGRWAECIVKKQQCNDNEVPTSAALRNFVDAYEEQIRTRMESFIQQQEDSIIKTITEPLRAKGWGAAGVFYNRISQMNGEMVTAVYTVPQPSQYPYAMREIEKQQLAQSDNVGPEQQFSMTLPDGQAIKFARGDSGKAVALAEVRTFKLWQKNDVVRGNNTEITGNVFIDGINLIFGTSGIFDMRKNADVHPLGQLSSLGRGMMEATVRNIGIGLGAEGGKMMFSGLAKELSGVVGGFIYSMGMTTMAMSFVLFYVLPFLPFLYFFFAIANWIKTIFEAIVAMPLWALGHIAQLDSEGLMGRAAFDGYVLIFEIVLRPILIVVGLIASVVIFSAMAIVLNDIFDLVIYNVSGFDVTNDANDDVANMLRSPVDEFFYTVLYTILIYLIGVSSFKLIDLIPQNILRWMGQEVKTYQGIEPSAVEGILQRSYASANVLSGNFKGGLLAGLV